MRIEIGKFVMESDYHGVSIYEKMITGSKSKIPGLSNDKICGSYSDMTSALIGLHRHVCLRSAATTLQELTQEINDYKAMVLHNINPEEFPALYRRKKKVSEL